jgi:hypothetical protein
MAVVTLGNVDIGELPNDGTGDPLRTAFDKINHNFEELATLAPNGPAGSFQFEDNGSPNGTANFAYVSSNNTISLGANIAPIGNVTIGTNAIPIANIFLAKQGLRIGNVSVVESGNVLSFPISVLPINKASFEINNLDSDGNVTATGNIIAANTKISSFEIDTYSNIADQVIFQMPATLMKNGRFVVDSREISSNNSQTATVVINKATNNLSAKFSVYGTVFSGNVVTDYNVDVGYGNVRLMVKPFPNVTVTHTVAYEITN